MVRVKIQTFQFWKELEGFLFLPYIAAIVWANLLDFALKICPGSRDEFTVICFPLYFCLQTVARLMKIWLDADACPSLIREILFRAAERVKIPLVLVANRYLETPDSRFIFAKTVPPDSNAADKYIFRRTLAGDLVVTDDMPFAAHVVTKCAYVLSHRGKLYTKSNIGEDLAFRNLIVGLRETGVETHLPKPLTVADRRVFAHELDRFLAKTNKPKPQYAKKKSS